MVKIFYTAFFFIAIVFFISCASENSPRPSGGNIDKSPLRLLSVYPLDSLATNVESGKVKLTFDKWVLPSSVQKGIRFYPSVDIYDVFVWHTEVNVVIYDTLVDNKTYVVTFPASIQAYETKEKINKTIQVAFSTGDYIDSGAIYGRVMSTDDNFKGSSVIVLAYFSGEEASSIQDSTGDFFLEHKPEYAVQADASGGFSFDYLRSGLYRIVAVKDDNRNFRYDSLEVFGVPTDSFIKPDSDSLFLKLTERSKNQNNIELQIVRAKSNTTVEVQFSDVLGIEGIVKDSITILDTALKQQVRIQDFSYRKKDEKTMLTLWLSDTLKVREVYKLMFKRPSSLTDSTLKEQTMFFLGKEEKDETKIELKPPFSRVRNDTIQDALEVHEQLFEREEKYLTIEYSRPVGRDSLQQAFSLYKISSASKNKVPIELFFYGGDKVFVKPNENFIYAQTYQLEIDSFMVDTTLVPRDSFYFKVVSKEKLGSVEGTVHLTRAFDVSPIVVLKRKKDGFTYRRYIDSSKGYHPFSFEKLPEGEYSLEAFVPYSSISKWDGGSAIPFKPSKPFYIHPRKINIRKRWTLEEIEIVL